MENRILAMQENIILPQGKLSKLKKSAIYKSGVKRIESIQEDFNKMENIADLVANVRENIRDGMFEIIQLKYSNNITIQKYQQEYDRIKNNIESFEKDIQNEITRVFK